jgi:glutaminyl-peptide cyclotransferase
MHRLLTIFALVFCCSSACARVENDAPLRLQWQVTQTYPHDVNHYTQGLELRDGKLLESVGRYGRSALYEKRIDDGAVLRSAALPPTWFGEGLTVWRDTIIVLTWLERTAQLFDLDLQPIAQHRYAGEGWGLTHDDRHLIMSDGSATLRFRRADDFAVVRELRVTDAGRPVTRLNELEYARGHVFANIWQSDEIALIDPQTGQVRAWIDLADLKTRFAKPASWDAREHVLNGIAYDAARDRFYVTGKCWPALFELDIAPLESDPRSTGTAHFR